MDFSLSEEQQEVRNLARQILEDLVTNDRLKELEASDQGIDRRVWGELAKANLLGVAVAEEYGGSAMGFFTLGVLLEEVGRTVAPLPAFPTLLLGALPIAEYGSEDQRRRWLPGVVTGETLLTAALQEPGTDEPARPTTSARPDADGWRLDGVKICVPGAQDAARMVIPARTAEGKAGVFLVDPEAEGVRLERQRTTSREHHYQVTLDGARVAATDVLGDPEDGTAITQWLVERATAGCCALQLGVSDRALRMTAEYTSSRIQFNRPIGSFQAVHMRAGDAFINVEAMRLTTWEALWRLEQGLPATEQVTVAKYWAAEGGQFVGYAAQHLHGGIGIDIDYPLHRYYLWAKQIELTLGSGSVQLARLGTAMAEAPAAPA